MRGRSPSYPAAPELAQVLERNIEAITRRRKREEVERPLKDQVADAVTQFTGSIKFVVLHVFFFGIWIVVNLPFVPFPKFDPTYVVLAMWASVEAIFLSTFVLITQNRMAELADKRDELNLQISLLAEHEVTRLIHLVTAIAERMDIEEAKNPELDELKRDVAPEKVLDTISEVAEIEHGDGKARG